LVRSKFGKKFAKDIKLEMNGNVRNTAYKITEGKQAIFYGIAGGFTKICHPIAMDSNALLLILSHGDSIQGPHDIRWAMPTIVNRSRTVKDLSRGT
jgi:malate/lactate dehydrogenase